MFCISYNKWWFPRWLWWQMDSGSLPSGAVLFSALQPCPDTLPAKNVMAIYNSLANTPLTWREVSEDKREDFHTQKKKNDRSFNLLKDLSIWDSCHVGEARVWIKRVPSANIVLFLGQFSLGQLHVSVRTSNCKYANVIITKMSVRTVSNPRPNETNEDKKTKALLDQWALSFLNCRFLQIVKGAPEDNEDSIKTHNPSHSVSLSISLYLHLQMPFRGL